MTFDDHDEVLNAGEILFAAFRSPTLCEYFLGGHNVNFGYVYESFGVR